MLVREIMSKDIISVSQNDTISKFISLLEKHHIHEALVLENKKLKGIVYSKKLTEKGLTDPSRTKINKVMNSPPPFVSPDDDIEEAANLIFNTGLRGIPVIDDKKVIGIVSMHDIIDFAAKTKEFRQTPVKSIMSVPETISQDEDIGKARVIMREKNISHLPIVDRDILVGLITTFDLLKAVKPRERMGWYSMAAEMDRIMNIPISTIMNRNPVTVSEDASLNETANKMSEYKTSGIIIIKDKKPVGIVILKDLLEVYVSGLRERGIYYQLIGLKDEDSFIVDTADRMVKDTLLKISSIFNVKFFFVHVKRYETGLKNRIKYSVRTRLKTDKDIFISRAWAWDLRDAIREALEKLERIILKQKETWKDKIRKNILKKGK